MLWHKDIEKPKHFKYIALGDSYTICEGATEEESWPNLLTKHLIKEGVSINLIANPSRTGWTTKDLIDNELPIFEKASPNFATLLIGVNDWVQGVDEKTFTRNLQLKIDRIQKKLPEKKKLILISIPDFGKTPKGHHYGRGRDISQGISAFNFIIQQEAQRRGLEFVDVFPVSQMMKDNTTLVSSDGLHPSAKEYAIWEALIFPKALALLK